MKSLLSLVLVVAGGLAAGWAEETAGDGKQEVPGNTVVAKLNEMVIPKVAMDGESVAEAWSFLGACSVNYDPEEDPRFRGVTFLLKGRAEHWVADEGKENAGEAAEVPKVPKVTYEGKDVRLLDLLREVARQGRLDVYVTEVGIVGGPEGVPPFPNVKGKTGEVWEVVRCGRADEAKRVLERFVPVVEFEEESAVEVMDFLRLCALELDPRREEAKKQGMSLEERLKLPDPGVFAEPRASDEKLRRTPRVTLRMKDATLGAVLREVARQAKLDVYLTTTGVLLRPAGTAAFVDEKEREANLVEVIYRWEE